MAKAKIKRKTKPPTIRGHNSSGAEEDAEMLRVAKAQRSLDKKRDAARAEWKDEQSKLTGRLKEISMSRKGFSLPYANWCAIQDAEDDDAAKQAREKNVLYLAEQRRAFDALSAGTQLDWIHLVEDAQKIQKTRAQAEREDAESAASESSEPTETRADV